MRRDLLLEALAVALLFVVFVYGAMTRTSPTGGVVQVLDHQVAVIQDGLRGTQRDVLAPGYQMIAPHVETVHALDKSPVEFVMAGETFENPNRVPRLDVRSRDGSSFWFDRVAIQYGLDTEQLDRVLQDSGPGDGFKSGLMNVYARSILRDELGRFSPEEVVAPDNIQSATREALRRLDEGMRLHGLTVFEISISKPSFDKRYEDTIERRKVAEQEIASLEREAEVVVAGEGAREAEIEGEHELALRKGRAQWAHELELLEKEAERLALGQQEELDQLESYMDLAVTKARAEWAEELAALDREAEELAAGLDERKAEKRRKHELRLLEARSKWDREHAALVQEGEARRALRDARIGSVQSDHDQRREEMIADLGQRQAAARQAAVSSVFEARSDSDSALLGARIERDRKIAMADVATARHRAEAEAFGVETLRLAENGESAVRAALVAKLGSIVFEIIPFSRPTPVETAEARKVSTRTAYDQ